MLPIRLSRLLFLVPFLLAVLVLIDRIAHLVPANASDQAFVSHGLFCFFFITLIYRFDLLLALIGPSRSTDASLVFRAEAIFGRAIVCAGATRKAQLVVCDSARSLAFALGDNRRGLVIVTSGMVKMLSDEALLGLYAHELSHVRLGHPLRISVILVAILTLKVVLALSTPVTLMVLPLYLYTRRQFELQADCQAARWVSSSTVVLALREYQLRSGDKDFGHVAQLVSSHPSIRYRIKALNSGSVI